MIYFENDNTPPLHLLGVGLIKISNLNVGGTTQIIFQKGIGIQLVNVILNLNKNKIITKKQGILIDLISDYTVYIHYFNSKPKEIIVIIYLDSKGSILKFSSYYEASKKLIEAFYCAEFSDIHKICSSNFIIPQSDSLLAFLIINYTGHLFYSKINDKKCRLGNFEVQISGFISALLIFSKEIIGQGPDVELKQINFGNQQINLVIKNNLIFTYLVEEEKISKLDRKYMQIVSDEFLDMFKDCGSPQNFDVALSKYREFGTIVDRYFVM